MVFSSNIFIFFFLPITIIVSFLLGKKARNYFLLFASLLFYAWGEPKFVLVMIASIVLNYIFAVFIAKSRMNGQKAKVLLAACVTANLSLLFVFKYLNFTVDNLNLLFADNLMIQKIALPIGISFFTFQAISYVIDVYRGSVAVQKNPFYLGLYISFFPQLIAGPIVRYSDIAEQIKERTIGHHEILTGIRRFILGFNKKVLIANSLALVADKAFSLNPSGELSSSFAWLGVIAYSFQILFDFSGYSDMAIGLGRMFGFRFLENFNYPYISKSVSEFWRRWHISLSTWFRDYIYFPMGGSRVDRKSRLVFNLFVVWLLTGIWHGASWNFIAWGMFYFVLLTVEKLSGYPDKFRHKAAAIIYRCFTITCILLGWVLFRASDLPHALNYMLSMFGLHQNPGVDFLTLVYLREFKYYLIFGLLFCIPLKRLFIKGRSKEFLKLAEIVSDVLLVIMFLVSLSYLSTGSFNPFIYFNF